MGLRWVEKECLQNFSKDAVKISPWKAEKEVDITIKGLRMGGGWNWYRANPSKYQQP